MAGMVVKAIAQAAVGALGCYDLLGGTISTVSGYGLLAAACSTPRRGAANPRSDRLERGEQSPRPLFRVHHDLRPSTASW